MPDDTEKVRQEYIKDLYADYKYSIEKFDSQALYISSGALGISLAFVKDFVPVANAVALWLFYAAIWAFVLVILLGFIAHYRSSKLIEKRISLVDEGKLNEVKEDTSIDKINKVIIWVLMLGIGALVLFVSLNLSAMSKQQSKKVITETPKKQKGSLNEKALKPKPLPSALNPSGPQAGNQSGNQGGGKDSTQNTGKTKK